MADFWGDSTGLPLPATRKERERKPREATIEARICAYARNAGWLVYKFKSENNRGVPDRLFIRNGRVVFLEIKQPGKQPTEAQTREINRIIEAGVMASWVDNLEDAIRVLGS